MAELLGLLVSIPVVVAASRWVLRRKTARLAAGAKVACTLRVVQGELSGIGPKWRPGYAALRPGVMAFSRQFRSSPVLIPVGSLDRSTSRRPSGKEVLSVDPDAVIVRIVTEGAVLEWAVGNGRSDWAFDLVSGPTVS